MKKILALILTIFLSLVLVACGGEGTPGDTDIGETGTETNEGDVTNSPKTESALPEGINPDDFYKFVQFELPENFRKAAVDQMRKQAAIVWTPEYTFTYGNKFDNWGYEKTYEAGVKYTGLPYGASRPP